MKARFFKCFGLLALLLFLVGCPAENRPEATGKLAVSCGLPPISGVIKSIGADAIEVHCLLPEGRSPHDYAPSPRDLRGAAKSQCYFSTGINFEEQVASALPKTVRYVRLGNRIRRLPEDGCQHDHHHHHNDAGDEADEDHHHEHDGEDGDPHIWLSCRNAAVLAEEVCAALCEADPDHAEKYRRNLHEFSEQLRQLDDTLRRELAPYAGRTFMVYHPAFGYFAADYGLHQQPVELSGREVSAAHLSEIIRKAKADGIKLIFVQKQFNPVTAATLAEAIGGRTQELDPLSEQLTDNLRGIGSALKEAWKSEDK